MPPLPDSPRQRWATWAFSLSAVALTVFGIFRLIADGPFGWHVRQPSFIQGGLELLVLTLILGTAMAFARGRARVLLVLAAAAIYFRLHSIDFAVMGALTYGCGIYGLGWSLTRILKISPSNEGYLYRNHALRIFTGLALLASVLFLGGFLFAWSYESSRAVAVALAIAGCVATLASVGQRRPITLPWPTSRWTALFAAVIMAVLAAAVARSNTLIYYDSIWYGMRPDRVLFGAKGLFEFIGLTTQVHYYPKLFEVVLSPLQSSGDFSLAIAANALCAVLFCMAVVSLARQMDLSRLVGMAAAALVLCTPAAAGSVETTKGDILAITLVIFASSALCSYYRRRDPGLLVDVAVFALLASTVRLAVLPWLALIFVAWSLTVATGPWRKHVARGDWQLFRHLLLAIPAALAFLLTHLRTFVLTGTPLITNASLQESLSTLGFSLRFPVGSLLGAGSREGLATAADVLLNTAVAPQLYEFHVFKWMGAAWLAGIAIIALRLFPLARKNGAMLVLGLAAIFPALLAFNAWTVRGGDGNYFLVSITAIYLAALATLDQQSRVLRCALLFCVLGGTCAYLFSSNWVTGTRPFSASLLGSPWDQYAQTREFQQRDVGIAPISDILAKCSLHLRVAGTLPLPAAFTLPVQYEPIQEWTWNNSESFRGSSSFAKLTQATDTDLIIFRKPTGPGGSTATTVDQQLAPLLDQAAVARARLVWGYDLVPLTSEGQACLEMR